MIDQDRGGNGSGWVPDLSSRFGVSLTRTIADKVTAATRPMRSI
jgi:hypothetical protein